MHKANESFSNEAIEVVEVAMNALESLDGALFIEVDFCSDFRESSCFQLSELTGVLQGSFLKKESNNTSA